MLYNLCIFLTDIPHDSFVNDKGKVQTHTFSDFPPTAESDEDDVYDKSQVGVVYIQPPIYQCSLSRATSIVQRDG